MALVLALRGDGPVAAPERITVTRWQYYMDGTLTGEMSLLSEPRMCLWKSARTGLQTPWHGD